MIKKILTAALLSLIAITAFAKPEGHLGQIRVSRSHVTVDRTAGQLLLTLDFVLDDLWLGTNELIILTPKIAYPDGSYTEYLEPIYVTGGTRDKMLSRQIHFGHEPDYYEALKPQSITRRHNHTAQTVSYSTSIPYDARMDGAGLALEEWLTGCAECDGGTSQIVLLSRLIREPYTPSFTPSYMDPEVETIKSRADMFSATIAFRLDDDTVDRHYRDNAAILDEVDQKIRSLKANKDITITGITLEGWASPEATVAYNKALSQRRAEASARDLAKNHGIARSQMTVVGRGEDWPTTEQLIRESGLSYKADLLEILDRYSGDARDPKIRELNGGAPFYDLVKNLYSKVRRTDYTVAYTVKAFDLEEAKQIIRTNPKLLSLKEMALVAGSYPTGSKEYHEVMQIAAKTFPDQPVALNNGAASALQTGDYSAALTALERIATPASQSLNNKGIALALAGRYDEARSCLERAQAAGDPHAAANLAELERLVESVN